MIKQAISRVSKSGKIRHVINGHYYCTVDPLRFELACILRSAEAKQEDIAACTNISRPTVSRLLKNEGMASSKRLSPEERRSLYKLYNPRVPLRLKARILGVNLQGLSELCCIPGKYYCSVREMLANPRKVKIKHQAAADHFEVTPEAISSALVSRRIRAFDREAKRRKDKEIVKFAKKLIRKGVKLDHIRIGKRFDVSNGRVSSVLLAAGIRTLETL